MAPIPDPDPDASSIELVTEIVIHIVVITRDDSDPQNGDLCAYLVPPGYEPLILTNNLSFPGHRHESQHEARIEMPMLLRQNNDYMDK
jgi:hypothetical protein